MNPRRTSDPAKSRRRPSAVAPASGRQNPRARAQTHGARDVFADARGHLATGARENFDALETRAMPPPSRARGGLLAASPLIVSLFLVFLVGADYRGAGLVEVDDVARVGADPCASVRVGEKLPTRAPDGELALVTGGAGFIGSTLAELLLSLGSRVRVLDNLSTGDRSYVPEGAEFVEGDVRDYEAVESAVSGGVAVVFHLAAMSKVEPSLGDPKMIRFCLDNNVLGTDNVLRASLTAKVSKVVYAASSTYYGNQPTPFAETLEYAVSSPYAQTKREGEMLAKLYDELHGLPTVSLRLFMVYGERQPTEGAYSIVTGTFLRQAAAGEPLTIEGDGSHYRDFVHVADARAMVLAYQNPDARGTEVNVGSGDAVRVGEVADMISKEQVHVPRRENDLVGTLADTCKAKKLLGFETTRVFKDEMRRRAREAKEATAAR